MASPDSESFVRTFARGLDIIEVMGRGSTRRTLAELVEVVELPRTVVRRYLLTLIDLGFVQTDGKHYWLTPRVLRLGLSYLSTLPYWRHAQPALEELRDRINQSCALSVLDGEEIVYILRQHTKRILPMSPSLGSRLPAHAVSMGRMMLAGLSDDQLASYLEQAELKKLTKTTVVDRGVLAQKIHQARDDGFAWIDRELEDSICGLAVPVRDKTGTTIAAINVSLPAGAFTEAKARNQFLTELRQTASMLRSEMG